MRSTYYAKPLKMMDKDKYYRLFDAIEHPGDFSDNEIESLLADPELKEAYRLIAASRSALAPQPEPDIDSEWQSFAARHIGSDKGSGRRHIFRLPGRRNAAAIIIITVSVAAVAAGIGLRIASERNDSRADDIAAVADNRADDAAASMTLVPDTVAASDSTSRALVIFKNESLSDILDSVARRYGAEVVFDNADKRRLRLYYNWNPALGLEETVTQLNSFEQIDMTLAGNTITVR